MKIQKTFCCLYLIREGGKKIFLLFFGKFKKYILRWDNKDKKLIQKNNNELKKKKKNKKNTWKRKKISVFSQLSRCLEMWKICSHGDSTRLLKYWSVFSVFYIALLTSGLLLSLCLIYSFCLYILLKVYYSRYTYESYD